MRSFRVAFQGLGYVFRSQPNWRIELAAAVAAVALALVLALPPPELAVLALAIGLVLAFEAANTALEAALDGTEPSLSPALKHAKDASAAGVLIAALAAVAVGIALFGPRLFAVVAR